MLTSGHRRREYALPSPPTVRGRARGLRRAAGSTLPWRLEALDVRTLGTRGLLLDRRAPGSRVGIRVTAGARPTSGGDRRQAREPALAEVRHRSARIRADATIAAGAVRRPRSACGRTPVVCVRGRALAAAVPRSLRPMRRAARRCRRSIALAAAARRAARARGRGGAHGDRGAPLGAAGPVSTVRRGRPGWRGRRSGGGGAGAAVVAAAGAQRDRRGRAHEPRAGAVAEAARAAVARVARGYSNLEYDARDRRTRLPARTSGAALQLTGAEAALAVNNCAGAVLLAAAALAGPAREVVVSRGQLVEIGGGFRMPEVMAQAAPAGRGRHDQPHAPRGLRAGGRRRRPARSARAPVELRQVGFNGGGLDRGAGRARRAGDRRRRFRHPRRRPRRARDEPTVRRWVAAGAAWCASPATSCSVGRRRADRRPGATRSQPMSAPARARAAPRQALARGARGDAASSIAIPSARGRDPDAGDAVGRPAEAEPRRARAGSPTVSTRRGGRGRRRRRSAAARCRCSSCPAPRGGAHHARPLRRRACRARLRAGDPAGGRTHRREPLLLDPRTLGEDDIDVVAGAVRAALDG